MALALKFHYLDEDNEEQRFRAILGAIMSVGRALGVKFKKLPKYKPKFPKEATKPKKGAIPTPEELLSRWGSTPMGIIKK